MNPSAQKATETIRLIQFRAAYNLPVHVGLEKGFFRRRGIALEAAFTKGSEHTSRVLKEGIFHIGHTGADDVVADVEDHRDSDLFIFMGLHSGMFALVALPEVQDIGSLRGRLLGVDAKRSGFVLVLEKLLRDKGFGLTDYRLQEIGGWESRYQALRDGSISATLLTEPYMTEALLAGFRLLARVGEMIPDYLATCGAASRGWAGQHGDLLVRYIQSYREATSWCFDIRQRKECLDLLARHHGISGPVAEKALASLLDPLHGLYPDAAPNIAGIEAVIRLRAERGYLNKPLPPDKYFDRQYYHQALQRC